MRAHATGVRREATRPARRRRLAQPIQTELLTLSLVRQLQIESFPGFPWVEDSAERGALGTFEIVQVGLAEHLLKLAPRTTHASVLTDKHVQVRWALKRLRLDNQGSTTRAAAWLRISNARSSQSSVRLT